MSVIGGIIIGSIRVNFIIDVSECEFLIGNVFELRDIYDRYDSQNGG